jgi:DNA processing protein
MKALPPPPEMVCDEKVLTGGVVVIDGSPVSSESSNVCSGEVELSNGHPFFPAELCAIPSAPDRLFVLGKIPPAPRVAVVGSRDSDEYGLRLARAIALDLARAGVCVVSGGAGGIDTAALEGCLEGKGLPVAVLGTGLDVAYPASNRGLFEKVAAAGALVSEYPRGTKGHPSNFPKRNRIVSGLSLGVVVVRAALKSGSLITAQEALRQKRWVLAVPGPAQDPLSAGVHHLIRQGARLVESASDVLEALAIPSSGQRPLDLAQIPSEMNSEEKAIYELLGNEPCAIDGLTVRLGMNSGRVAALLLQMEMKGWIVSKPGMMYCRNRGT